MVFSLVPRAHAEIQFIFRNSKYASDAVASEAGDGYAGLAFLLRVPEASEPPVHHTMGVKVGKYGMVGLN